MSNGNGDDGDLAVLGAQFVEISEILRSDQNAQIDPYRLVRMATAAMPHAQYAAITLIRPSQKPRTIASSDPVAVAVDELQYATKQGPCLDASRGDEIALVQDLASDTRWPEFAKRCVEEGGIRSVLSARLSLSGQHQAALNFYVDTPHSYTRTDVVVASILAPFAALSVERLIHEEDVDQLMTALSTSRQIGRAVGILMTKESITPAEAFVLLRDASSHLNRQLREVAKTVEETGALPGRAQKEEDPPLVPLDLYIPLPTALPKKKGRKNK